MRSQPSPWIARATERLSYEHIEELIDALGAIAKSDARVVILAANGPVFCAGTTTATWSSGPRRLPSALRALREMRARAVDSPADHRSVQGMHLS